MKIASRPQAGELFRPQIVTITMESFQDMRDIQRLVERAIARFGNHPDNAKDRQLLEELLPHVTPL